MSVMYNFKPHSFYYGVAIRRPGESHKLWRGYVHFGTTHEVVPFKSATLKRLKQDINVMRLIYALTPEQQNKLYDLVHEIEYNPKHPDDTFNAGAWSVFFSYDYDDQMSLINRAKE